MHETARLHNAAGCLIIRGNNESAWQFVSGYLGLCAPCRAAELSPGFCVGVFVVLGFTAAELCRRFSAV